MFLLAMYEGSNFSTSLPIPVIVCLIMSILLSMKWYLMAFICVCLMANNVDSSCMFWSFVYVLWRNVIDERHQATSSRSDKNSKQLKYKTHHIYTYCIKAIENEEESKIIQRDKKVMLTCLKIMTILKCKLSQLYS